MSREQEEFINYFDGSAVLHAPVGTGKTLALALHAAAAIEQGMEPERILCVTFTNRAALELRQRVALKCGAAAKKIVVRTFHSLCAWMLRSEAKRIGLPREFTIYDEDDSIEAIGECAKKLGIQLISYKYENEVRDVYHLIADAKTGASVLKTGEVPEEVFAELTPTYRRLACAYQKELASRHGLDFADLIYFARAMLEDREIRKRWENRFSLIQVDEMQDTHLNEYQLLRVLARGVEQMVLVGDLDQTIYEWRGSEPENVLKHFRKDFPHSRSFSFTTNYRTTQKLLEAADSVVGQYSTKTRLQPCAAAEIGEDVVCHFAPDATMEAQWIAQQIRSLKKADESFSLSRVGVLVRTNNRAAAISDVFTRMDVPHFTVEQFDFFRRQEIKDAIAYLRFLLNPYDTRCLHRILLRPSRGIGEVTLGHIEATADLGLSLVDFVKPTTFEDGDPFARLLHEYETGSVVVFDTETTGLNPGTDEIVELGGIRFEQGKEKGRFHCYLRNKVSVGDAYHIHGLSDEFLAQKGVEPKQALAEFFDFIKGSLLVGHNVSYDLRMLSTIAQRLNLEMEKLDYVDTLDLARRFIEAENYSLEDLVDFLGLSGKPTHRVLDDVGATYHLLEYLIPILRKNMAARRLVVQKAGRAFEPLALEIQSLRELAGKLRPPELLGEVLKRSGLMAYYEKEERRVLNLQELLEIFVKLDDQSLDPISSLENILHQLSLARNVDRFDPSEEKVRILTVHQSKGLEFDVVFIAGLSQYEFPGYFAIKEGREEEELRLFYVALTRARKRLFMTGHALNRGKRRQPSPYFNIIGDNWVESGSSAIRRSYR